MAKKTGRPKRTIDYEAALKLARLGCTIDDIANYLEVSATTLKRDSTFRTNYKKGLEEVKLSLRRAQLKKAIEEKNTTMQIWLGKQLLGQRDDAEINAIRKEELELKKKELELKAAEPETPDIGAYVEAIGKNVKAAFEDEKAK